MRTKTPSFLLCFVPMLCFGDSLSNMRLVRIEEREKKCVDGAFESGIVTSAPTHGDIAQLGERVTGSHEVRGSNPLISTM